MSQKKKALTLTIPEPCHEKFNEMTPVKGGKFCGACEKTIVDFRKMSDRQILNFYKKNEGKICGVFDKVQLNRAMPFPIKGKPAQNWKAVAALTAGLIFSGGLFGQLPTPPTVGKMAVVEHTLVKGAIQEADETTPNQVIKGLVTDNKEPLIGANVFVKGTTIGVTTDIDGNFEITIPADLTSFELEVSYLGFETQTLLFNDKYPVPDRRIAIELVSNMIPEHEMIMGIIMVNHEEAPVCDVPLEEDRAEIPEIKPDLQTKGVSTDEQMTVYPNPFISDVKVGFDFAKKGDYLFLIYDVKGQLLFAKSYHLQKGQQTIELDVATQNLMDGVYILQISDNDDRILDTKKVYKGQA